MLVITDEEWSSSSIASATAIRKALSEQRSVTNFIPAATAAMIEAGSQQTWANYWPLLRYRLLSTELANLKTIYQMTEGLEVRMQSAAKEESHFFRGICHFSQDEKIYLDENPTFSLLRIIEHPS